MTSVEFKTHLKWKSRGNPGENQLQMNGSEYRKSVSDDASETRFSAWTPMTNKACNSQVRWGNKYFKLFYLLILMTNKINNPFTAFSGKNDSYSSLV